MIKNDYIIRLEEKAAEMGFGAVFIEGDINFYRHCGLTFAREFGIRYHGLPQGADDSFFLAKELKTGFLKGVTGVYSTPKGYFVADEKPQEFEEYESRFPLQGKTEPSRPAGIKITPLCSNTQRCFVVWMQFVRNRDQQDIRVSA